MVAMGEQKPNLEMFGRFLRPGRAKSDNQRPPSRRKSILPWQGYTVAESSQSVRYNGYGDRTMRQRRCVTGDEPESTATLSGVVTSFWHL